MTTSASLTGGQVLTPGGAVETADVHIADGRIVEAPAADSARIDCRGYCVLPGIVDVHGDAFEVELHPRPGVDIAFPIAMGSVDRQLLANGITTAFHGLTVSFEPGARSVSAAHHFMEGLKALRPRLSADHRVQLRWEVFAHEAVGDIDQWLRQDPAPAIAFNDHTTEALETMGTGNHERLARWARRAGVTLEQYLADIEDVSRRAPDVPAKIREVAALAREHGAVMLSHDEASCEQRAVNRGLGMRVCEFPLTAAVATDAVGRGEHVVMGGPNVINGGSHKGHMSAEDAVRHGQCTILASDYYYPSLLHAAERFVGRGVRSLGQAWNLISRNPAAAMGLEDRGVIEIGRRADLAVIDCTSPWRLVHTIAAGTVISFGR
ncbi:MAG: alpha-D-ribose 1-methylphosphonate 5-triphosphate diphosphatase [Pseudomonadota bacterium]